MNIKSKKPLKGFTIIEVMIVLAIAGLILLVVFLAVPALQRSQRNSARKSDASRIAASVIDYVSNDPTGALPTTAAQCGQIKDSAANLSQYNSIPAGACTAAAIGSATTANTMYLVAAAGTPGTATTNIMILNTNGVCNGSSATSAGTAKQAALLYTVESGSSWRWVCLNVQ